jgi:hypothetical protein
MTNLISVEEGRQLFMYYFNNKPEDIKSLHLVSGRTLSQIMDVKNGDQIYAKNIKSLYGKNFNLPNLKSVDYYINTTPFFDYSKVKHLNTSYDKLKYFNISKFRSIDHVIITASENGKAPNYSALKRMYPHAKQLGYNLYIDIENRGISSGSSRSSSGSSRSSSVPKKVCPDGKKLTKTGNRCIKITGPKPKKITIKAQRQTVCYEGYKMTKDAKCIKDKKYKTIVVPVETPVTGDLISFEEVAKVPSVSRTASYKNYMDSRMDEF